MTNPADPCRECELASRNRELEAENISLRQTGHRLAVEWESGLLQLRWEEESE